MTAFGGDECNKALIVSARCEIGVEWVPRAPVPVPALRAANTTPASPNRTAGSQRLDDLRLKTHTHNINQRRMDQPSVSSLGRCLQTVCAHQTWPLSLIGNISGFFFLSKDERLGGAASSDTFPFALSCPNSPPVLAFLEAARLVKALYSECRRGRNYILGKCLMYKYKNHMDVPSVGTTLLKQNRALPWEFGSL